MSTVTDCGFLGLTKVGLNVTLLEMSTALILISMHTWFFQQKHHGSIFTAIFRWFGRNSYEIYLTHMFVILAMSYIFIQYEMRAQFIPFLYLTILILTGIVGQLLAIYFSEPLNRLLRFKSENIIELQYSKEN